MKQLPFLVVVSFILAGCGNQHDDVVAKSGDLQLTRDELLASITYSSQEDSLTASGIYIEDWKDLAALYQLALEKGFADEAESKLLIEKATRQIIVQRFLDREIDQIEKKQGFAVDSSEVTAFYRAFPDLFVCSDTEYGVSRYYFSSAVTASRMKNALRQHQGDEESLIKLIGSIEPRYARKNMEARGKGLQLRALRQLHLENDNVKRSLNGMAPGEISSVISLHDSLFVIMEMHDIVMKGERKSLLQAYGNIEDLLIVEKQKQYYSTVLEKARKQFQ
ncbi:MAG: hypothetical protein OQK67_00965 [Chlorobium sp.]|nr:hypothetical protein [Chlorobium sp.]MCW8815045.1 hypothetical protein [Chlorobium sp.]MCW8820057.1 hypothetical protein [Ignavibacteriaceae bacterium]